MSAGIFTLALEYLRIRRLEVFTTRRLDVDQAIDGAWGTIRTAVGGTKANGGRDSTLAVPGLGRRAHTCCRVDDSLRSDVANLCDKGVYGRKSEGTTLPIPWEYMSLGVECDGCDGKTPCVWEW